MRTEDRPSERLDESSVRQSGRMGARGGGDSGTAPGCVCHAAGEVLLRVEPPDLL